MKYDLGELTKEEALAVSKIRSKNAYQAKCETRCPENKDWKKCKYVMANADGVYCKNTCWGMDYGRCWCYRHYDCEHYEENK